MESDLIYQAALAVNRRCEGTAVYNSEDGFWYEQGRDPWTVRDVPKGGTLHPLNRLKADSLFEAHRGLFGGDPYIPMLVREGRREEEEVL